MAKRVPVSAATKEYDKLLKIWPGLDTLFPQIDSVSDPYAIHAAASTLSDGIMENPLELMRATLEDDEMLEPEDMVWLSRWSRCRQVYRIDPVLADEISHQEFQGKIPVEALSRLPYPIIYVDAKCHMATGAGKIEAQGFFAWTDKALSDLAGPDQIMVCYLFKNRKRSILALSLGHETIDGVLDDLDAYENEAFDKLSRSHQSEHVVFTSREDAAEQIAETLNLLLYVIHEEVDVEVTYRPPTGGRGQQVGPRTNRETQRIVGARVGRAIGEARRVYEGASKADGTRTVSAHVRRAHWQHYWTGQRKGRIDGKHGDDVVLRWIPPIYVNGAGDPIEIVHESR